MRPTCMANLNKSNFSFGLVYLVSLIMGERCKTCCSGLVDQSLYFPGFVGPCPLSNWELWLSHSFRYESWYVWEVILFKNYWKVWEDISPVLKRQKRYKINLIEGGFYPERKLWRNRTHPKMFISEMFKIKLLIFLQAIFQALFSHWYEKLSTWNM